MLTVEKMVFNQIEENTYIVRNEAQKECAIVDAGCRSRLEKIRLRKKIDENGDKVVALLNTHLHFDHIYGNKFVYETWNLLTSASARDEFFIRTYLDQLNLFGFPTEEQAPGIGRCLTEGDRINIGDDALVVIETPGHSEGGLSFYSESGKFCLTGDTLFRGSVGRTDFPGGSMEQIVKSIREKILTLGDDVRLLPGHGEETSVRWEKQNNPYIAQ